MSATGRPEETAPDASDVATRMQDSGLVRLVVAPSGDAVAAAGLLIRALEAHGVAYHSSVVGVPDSARRGTDSDLTIGVGRPAADADLSVGTTGVPASTTALAVGTELGTVEYELALAGITAAGAHPPADVLAAAKEHGITRHPGVAVPTADLADGLAHSSLLHATFSGDVEAVGEMLADIGVPESADAGGRQVASTVALAVAEEERSTPRAAGAVERFLHPLVAPGGRFETVAGFGDVLAATARAKPDLALPVALGADDTGTALGTWRAHATAVHETIRSASTGRYDGLFVARCEGTRPLRTVARLVADFRSPEPLVLAVDDGHAVATVADEADQSEHVGAQVAAAAASVGGIGDGTATTGRARFEVEPTEFVAVFREER